MHVRNRERERERVRVKRRESAAARKERRAYLHNVCVLHNLRVHMNACVQYT